jgi:GT2 family glycosyltransferase
MRDDVAVLMAAYNAEGTIRAAVDSLRRGNCPCHIYIVDDCSRVPVRDVLRDIEGVEIIRLECNVGPAAARNAGLARILANGHAFIAIMDADDVARADRLAKQREYLIEHGAIALVGSWERYFDEGSGAIVGELRLAQEPEQVRQAAFLNLSVPHPTWMVRASVFAEVGGYSERYAAAEDYDLLRRILRRYKAAIIPEFLLDYRISSSGVSQRRRRRQIADRLAIQLRYFEWRECRAYAGVARTLASFAIPRRMVGALGNRARAPLSGAPALRH